MYQGKKKKRQKEEEESTSKNKSSSNNTFFLEILLIGYRIHQLYEVIGFLEKLTHTPRKDTTNPVDSPPSSTPKDPPSIPKPILPKLHHCKVTHFVFSGIWNFGIMPHNCPCSRNPNFLRPVFQHSVLQHFLGPLTPKFKAAFHS